MLRTAMARIGILNDAIKSISLQIATARAQNKGPHIITALLQRQARFHTALCFYERDFNKFIKSKDIPSKRFTAYVTVDAWTEVGDCSTWQISNVEPTNVAEDKKTFQIDFNLPDVFGSYQFPKNEERPN